MSANIATNFPPQTYSSQFFLNTLCDDVGASTSKKRSKSPQESTEPSNAVLDCFISTMPKKLTKYVLIFAILCLQFGLSTAQKRYTCIDGSHTQIQKFENILSFQGNSMNIDATNNFISFKTPSINRLKTNDFLAHGSNLIRKLILSEKRIQKIDIGSFNELYCLKYLYLQSNLISQIENGTFGALFNLQELNLSDNNIQNITEYSFFNLKHLLKLDLSGNKIKILYDYSFEYLKSLYELNLSKNQISELPNKLFVPTNHLKNLYIGYNKISIFNKTDYLQNLELLDMENNIIQSIGTEVLLNLNIVELNLFANKLSELNISYLPKTLEKINIGHNNFQCDYLEKLLENLIKFRINLINNNEIISGKIDTKKIGCYNGSIPHTVPPTTTERPYFTTTIPSSTTTQIITISSTSVNPNIENHFWKIEQQNRNIFESISGLKIFIIVLIIIVVVFYAFDIMLRTNIFERMRIRYQNRQVSRQYGDSRYSDYSFPLLQR